MPRSSNLIWWGGLNTGTDPAMVNHLRFTQDLIRLRWNQPALRGDNVNPFHVNDPNRVIAFHRWLEARGKTWWWSLLLPKIHGTATLSGSRMRAMARGFQQRRLR